MSDSAAGAKDGAVKGSKAPETNIAKTETVKTATIQATTTARARTVVDTQGERVLACVERALAPFKVPLREPAYDWDDPLIDTSDYAWMAKLRYPTDPVQCKAILKEFEDAKVGTVPHSYVGYLHGVVEDAVHGPYYPDGGHESPVSGDDDIPEALSVDVTVDGRTVKVVDWDFNREGRCWGVVDRSGKHANLYPLVVKLDPTNATSLRRDIPALLAGLPPVMSTGVARSAISRVHLSGNLSRQGGVCCVFLSFD